VTLRQRFSVSRLSNFMSVIITSTEKLDDDLLKKLLEAHHLINTIRRNDPAFMDPGEHGYVFGLAHVRSAVADKAIGEVKQSLWGILRQEYCAVSPYLTVASQYEIDLGDEYWKVTRLALESERIDVNEVDPCTLRLSAIVHDSPAIFAAHVYDIFAKRRPGITLYYAPDSRGYIEV
jgi:hypothetical protein